MKQFDWLIRTAMYAITGCILIAIGDRFLIAFGVGLVFVAIFYSNLVIATKVRDDIITKGG
jgi:hypothetical protein